MFVISGLPTRLRSSPQTQRCEACKIQLDFDTVKMDVMSYFHIIVWKYQMSSLSLFLFQAPKHWIWLLVFSYIHAV